MDKWEKYVAKMIDVKDGYTVFVNHPPEPAATEEQIREVERHLGYRLEEGYRSFLQTANGWKGFYHTTDLFGTADLLGSPAMKMAESLLAALSDEVIEGCGFTRDELLPIAAEDEYKNLVLISHEKSHTPGVVMCFQSKLYERYASFEKYFDGMYHWCWSDMHDGIY